MKVKFRHAVRSFHGKFKTEGLVYCRYNNGALYLARKYPFYTPSDQNHNIGNAGRNIGRIWYHTAPEYKHDLKTYAKLLANYTNLDEKLPASSYVLFTKMLYAMKKQIPEIDLTTLTTEEIIENAYPARTVADAMNTGLLFSMDEAANLEHEI